MLSGIGWKNKTNKHKQRFLFEVNVLGFRARVSTDRSAELTVECTVQTSKGGTLWSRGTAARIKPSPRGESILGLALRCLFYSGCFFYEDYQGKDLLCQHHI